MGAPRHAGTSRAITAGLAVLLAAGFAACGSSGSGAGKGAKSIDVKLTDQGCSPAKLTATAGPIDFNVTNGGTSAVTEMEIQDASGVILGERENVVQGLSGSFSLTLQPGAYKVYCPNGSGNSDGVLTVTGKPLSAATGPTAPLLAQASNGYRVYVGKESKVLLASTKKFVAALQAGDVAQAKELFAPARYHYESIEPVAESFGNLDPEIDARINDVKSVSMWTGFHRIERTLWESDTTKGTEKYASKLLADITTLIGKAKTLEFQAAQLANGASGLLDEVGTSKITGEEDRYSHTDLSDFEANVAGAKIAVDLLTPALVKDGQKKLTDQLATAFADVTRSLAPYKRNTALGFVPYDTVNATGRKALAAPVERLSKLLKGVATKVNG